VLVKSPIELVVGALRQFDMKPIEATPFAVAAAGMGQNLFAPPNVKGWPGQETWINASTLLARKQFLERLFRGEESSPRMLGAVDGEASITNDAVMTGAVPNQERLPGALDPDAIARAISPPVAASRPGTPDGASSWNHGTRSRSVSRACSGANAQAICEAAVVDGIPVLSLMRLVRTACARYN
jgi:hypothetical protein